ncbi:Gfo/Idh/MocA family protein [Jiangella alkaliphila]|uniref:Predicted dehydrogenase n=1 Tax=Jiangella alkaliphila TaxID=419479 RepID=A0A1H2K3M0_9ACTN|nr:Gfo/Idh/MocA family oxidoreductase [Jiangella alkaliphila]SDU63299.1 Predicted dehydrogenase [Jiangella alkaliphila]
MKVLVVGVGFMGAMHARAVHETRSVELCGVVDRSADAARAVGAQLGVPAFTDLEAAIRELAPDAAVVATPDSAHLHPVRVLIEAGVHVLVEKPLATSIDDAEAIADLAERHGTRLMTGHITRFMARYAGVVDAVRSGRLGRPVMITTSTWGPRSIGARVASTTSPLWHFAIHDIDLIQWIGRGEIDEVDGAQLLESPSGVATFTATGVLTNGMGFNLVTGWTLPDTAAPRWDLKVHCEDGMIQSTKSNDSVTEYSAEGVDEPDRTAWPVMYDRIEGALRLEVGHFLDALATGTPFLVSVDDAIAAVRGATALEKASVARRAS